MTMEPGSNVDLRGQTNISQEKNAKNVGLFHSVEEAAPLCFQFAEKTNANLSALTAKSPLKSMPVS